MNWKVGEILPNGSTLLKFHEIRDNFFVVLAHWNRGLGPDGEYITWFSNEKGETVVGIYGDLDSVLKKYNERIKDSHLYA